MAEHKSSLLESEAQGGDIAQGGFTFQEQVMLSLIPRWIAQDGFSEMTYESMGDIEAKFFVPGLGYVMEFVEVKESNLPPAKFWDEVSRFRKIDSDHPGAYNLFTLISANLSDSLHPITNALRRVRNPYRFYESVPTIQTYSLDAYIKIVEKHGHTKDEALFLFNKVRVEDNWSAANPNGEALFKQASADYLPGYEDLSLRVMRTVYEGLGSFLRMKRNQPITRLELEEKLRENIPENLLPDFPPVCVYTSIHEQDKHQEPGLRFGWASFFGGEKRIYPPPEQWNQQMLKELEQTQAWIMQQRITRRIKLTGDRRLSTALAIGSVFSAVAGFAIEMQCQGMNWITDAHPKVNTPAYPLDCKIVGTRGKHLVVSIGIIRDITETVDLNLDRLGLIDAPRLYISGKGAIFSSQHANVAVQAIKGAIDKALVQTGSQQIHLFFAGPSHLALFLGHRLNATASIQCYELDSARQYVPTCKLN